MGTSKQRELKVSGRGSSKGLGGKYETQKDLEWQVLYNPKALPGFVPIEKVKDLMAGTVAVSSESAAIFSSDTRYVEAEEKTIEEKSLLVNDTEINVLIQNFNELNKISDDAKELIPDLEKEMDAKRRKKNENPKTAFG